MQHPVAIAVAVAVVVVLLEDTFPGVEAAWRWCGTSG